MTRLPDTGNSGKHEHLQGKGTRGGSDKRPGAGAMAGGSSVEAAAVKGHSTCQASVKPGRKTLTPFSCLLTSCWGLLLTKPNQKPTGRGVRVNSPLRLALWCGEPGSEGQGMGVTMEDEQQSQGQSPGCQCLLVRTLKQKGRACWGMMR